MVGCWSRRRRMVQVYVRRWLGEFALRLDEAGLEADNVVAELVVLCLDGFIAIIKGIVFADLLFQALDVTLFALSERSLLL